VTGREVLKETSNKIYSNSLDIRAAEQMTAIDNYINDVFIEDEVLAIGCRVIG